MEELTALEGDTQQDYDILQSIISSDNISFQIDTLENLCMDILIKPQELQERYSFIDDILPVVTKLLEKLEITSELLNPAVRVISYMVQENDGIINSLFDPQIFSKLKSLVSNPNLDDYICRVNIEEIISILFLMMNKDRSEFLSCQSILLNLLLNKSVAHLHSPTISKICEIIDHCCQYIDYPNEEMFNLLENSNSIISKAMSHSIKSCTYNFKRSEHELLIISRIIPAILYDDIDWMCLKIIEKIYKFLINYEISSIATISRVLFHCKDLPSKIQDFNEPSIGLAFISAISGLVIEFGTESDKQMFLPICFKKVCEWPRLCSLRIIHKLIEHFDIWEYQSEMNISEILNQALSVDSRNDSVYIALNILRSLAKLDRENTTRFIDNQGYVNKLNNIVNKLEIYEDNFTNSEFSMIHSLWSEFEVEVIVDRPWLIDNFCIVKTAQSYYIWSDMIVLKMCKDSNGWFTLFFNNKLHIVYSSGLIKCNTDFDFVERVKEFTKKLNLVAGAASNTFFDQLNMKILKYENHGNWTIRKHDQNKLVINNSMSTMQLELCIEHITESRLLSTSGVYTSLFPDELISSDTFDTCFIQEATKHYKDKTNIQTELYSFLNDFGKISKCNDTKEEAKDNDQFFINEIKNLSDFTINQPNLNDIQQWLTRKLNEGINSFTNFFTDSLSDKDIYNLKEVILPYIDCHFTYSIDYMNFDHEQDLNNLNIYALLVPEKVNDCTGFSLKINILNDIGKLKSSIEPMVNAMWCRIPRCNLKHYKILKESGYVCLNTPHGVIDFYSTDAGAKPPLENVFKSGLINVNCQSTISDYKQIKYNLQSDRPAQNKSFLCIDFDIIFPLDISRYKFSMKPSNRGPFIEWILSGSTDQNTWIRIDERIVCDDTEFEIKNCEHATFRYFRFELIILWIPDNSNLLIYDLDMKNFEFYGILKFNENDNNEMFKCNNDTKLHVLRKGDRVVRGKDWCWNDQDLLGPGTVMDISNCSDWVKVRWDRNHKTNVYRMNDEYEDLIKLKCSSRNHKYSEKHDEEDALRRKFRNKTNLQRGSSMICTVNQILNTQLKNDKTQDNLSDNKETLNETLVNSENICEDIVGSVTKDNNETKAQTTEGKIKESPLKFYDSMDAIFTMTYPVEQLIASEDSKLYRQFKSSRLLYKSCPHNSDIIIALNCDELTKSYDSNNENEIASIISEIDWKSEAVIKKNTVKPEFSLELHISYYDSLFKHKIKLTDEKKPLLYYLILLYRDVYGSSNTSKFCRIFNNPIYKLVYISTSSCMDLCDDTDLNGSISTSDQTILLMDKLNRLGNSPGLSNCLKDKVLKQFSSGYLLLTNLIPNWCKEAMINGRSCIPFDYRLKYFYSTSFGTGRSIVEFENNTKLNDESYDPYFLLKVERFRISRLNILDDACACLKYTSCKRVSIDFAFENEEGIGTGPTTEAFQLIANAFQQHKLAMWLSDNDCGHYGLVHSQNGLFPAPYPTDNSEKFKDVVANFKHFGRFIGRCLLDKKNVDITLSVALVKLICFDKMLSYHDMIHVDPIRARLFEYLIDHKESLANYIYGLGLSMEFNPPSDIYGYKYIPLTSEREYVTLNNRFQYIDKTIQLMFSDGIHRQIEAIRNGINECFPIECLKCFEPEELIHMIHGDCDLKWTILDLRQSIKVKHGFREDSFEYNALLDILIDFEIEERKQFIQFVTGSRSLPPGGILKLHPLISISMKDDGGYPSVNTCMHNLKLPSFQCSNQFRELLLTSMYYAVGFDFN